MEFKDSLSKRLTLPRMLVKDMVVVLDTRNDYEVRLATFDKAVNLDLKSFRAFPSKVRVL